MTGKQKLLCSLVALIPLPALAQMPGVTMEVDIDNFVVYNFDAPDWANWARLPGPVTAAVAPPGFGSFLAVADIVAVNGKPAKGAWVLRQTSLNFRPSPSPGQAIADVNRSGVIDEVFEFLQDDGTSLGSFMASGLNSGDRPPGAPTKFPGSNVAIVGGTGAFLGMRGQASTTMAPPGAKGIRGTSVTEDPANRRGFGGGNRHIVFHLIPLQRPEIVALFHSDFSPVSASSPAHAGETLIVSATGLGPTRPGVDPGQPFPASPLQELNSPFDLKVNGESVVVLNKVGWPDTTGVYRVDFRVPDGTAAGIVTIQLSAAWLPGPEMEITVQ